jgi:hypothetical protein
MSNSKPAAIAAVTTSSSTISKQKHRSKGVSFSDDVLCKDKIGDGNKVSVKEEPGVFLSLLGQRRVIGNNTNKQRVDEEIIDISAEGISKVSFGGDHHDTATSEDELLQQKLTYSEKEDGIIIQSPKHTTKADNSSDIEYDNLVVKVGLLKIGHRYQMSVPIPQLDYNSNRVSIVEDSMDDDLRGEIETDYVKSGNDDHSSSSSSPSSTITCQHYLSITLSAKRRGPYRGRFVLELTTQPSQNASAISEKESTQHTKKCIMSVQVDATIMGKDMGTPKLRNGVICLGKIVGYDSDDETEWQGFD